MGKKKPASKNRKTAKSSKAQKTTLAPKSFDKPPSAFSGGLDYDELSELYDHQAFDRSGYLAPEDQADPEPVRSADWPGLKARNSWFNQDWLEFLRSLEGHEDEVRLKGWLLLKPYGLYNALTQALFQDHDYELALSLAKELAVSSDHLKSSLFKDCAAIALDGLQVLRPDYKPVKIDTKIK
ncbi:MAG: hypothetical protein LBE80_05155, partial [Deltaproteobacteria bacterium]|nr:hypothetical protein [Deltaproteobacteria bacterium]